MDATQSYWETPRAPRSVSQCHTFPRTAFSDNHELPGAEMPRQSSITPIETLERCNYAQPNSRTLRANADVFSLENVRSPALMWMSEPGVAPLSRAYPRLLNAVPSGLSRRFATKLNAHSFSTLASERRSKRWQEPF
jgi:hypothetical protein